jgi:enamine deaminase RidA (YjgF/YER057c/UK114 family)
MSSEPGFQLSIPGTMPRSVGYSQVATVSSGRIIFIAGQVALDVNGEVVGQGDIQVQARQVFENLRAALHYVGGSFRDVIKLNSYFIDISALGSFRAVRDDYVNLANPPVSTAVEVARLFRPEFLLEVEAVAVIKGE